MSLIKHLQTGNHDQYEEYLKHWSADYEGNIELLFGFLGIEEDPMAQRGTITAMVLVHDQQSQAFIDSISSKLQQNIDRLPNASKSSFENRNKSNVRVCQVLCATGNAGPICPKSYRIPPYRDFQQIFGEKSLHELRTQQNDAALVVHLVLYSPEWDIVEVVAPTLVFCPTHYHMVLWVLRLVNLERL